MDPWATYNTQQQRGSNLQPPNSSAGTNPSSYPYPVPLRSDSLSLLDAMGVTGGGYADELLAEIESARWMEDATSGSSWGDPFGTVMQHHQPQYHPGVVGTGVVSAAGSALSGDYGQPPPLHHASGSKPSQSSRDESSSPFDHHYGALPRGGVSEHFFGSLADDLASLMSPQHQPQHHMPSYNDPSSGYASQPVGIASHSQRNDMFHDLVGDSLRDVAHGLAGLSPNYAEPASSSRQPPAAAAQDRQLYGLSSFSGMSQQQHYQQPHYTPPQRGAAAAAFSTQLAPPPAADGLPGYSSYPQPASEQRFSPGPPVEQQRSQYLAHVSPAQSSYHQGFTAPDEQSSLSSAAARTVLSNGLPCRFFQQGSCKKGPYCEFVHLDPNLAGPMTGRGELLAQPQQRSKKRGGRGGRRKKDAAAANSQSNNPNDSQDSYDDDLDFAEDSNNALFSTSAANAVTYASVVNADRDRHAAPSAPPSHFASSTVPNGRPRASSSNDRDEGWSTVHRGMRPEALHVKFQAPPVAVDNNTLGRLLQEEIDDDDDDYDDEDGPTSVEISPASHSKKAQTKRERKDELRRMQEERRQEQARAARLLEEEEEEEELRRQAEQAELERERQRKQQELLRAQLAKAGQREALLKQKKKEERERRRAEANAARMEEQARKALLEKERRQQRAEARRQEEEQRHELVVAEQVPIEGDATSDAAVNLSDSSVAANDIPPMAKLVNTPSHTPESKQGDFLAVQGAVSPASGVPVAEVASRPLNKEPPTVVESPLEQHAPPAQPGTIVEVLDAVLEASNPERKRGRASVYGLPGERVGVLLHGLRDEEVSAWLDGDYTVGSDRTSFIFAPGVPQKSEGGSHIPSPPTVTEVDTPLLLRELDVLLEEEAKATAAALQLQSRSSKVGEAGIPKLVSDEASSKVIVPQRRTGQANRDEEAATWDKYWQACETELELEADRRRAWYFVFRRWLWSNEACCSSKQRREINRIKHARTHYEVLDASRDMTQSQLENCWRRVAVRLHECSFAYVGGGGTPPTIGALASFRAAYSAQSILLNPTTRAIYDSNLRRGGGRIETHVNAFGSDGPISMRFLRMMLLGLGMPLLFFAFLFRVLKVLLSGLNFVVPPVRKFVRVVSGKDPEELFSHLSVSVPLPPVLRDVIFVDSRFSNNPAVQGSRVSSNRSMVWCDSCKVVHNSGLNETGPSCPMQLQRSASEGASKLPAEEVPLPRTPAVSPLASSSPPPSSLPASSSSPPELPSSSISSSSSSTARVASLALSSENVVPMRFTTAPPPEFFTAPIDQGEVRTTVVQHSGNASSTVVTAKTGNGPTVSLQANVGGSGDGSPLLSVELDDGALYSSFNRVVYVPTKPHHQFGMKHQDVTDLLQFSTVLTLLPLLPKLESAPNGGNHAGTIVVTRDSPVQAPRYVDLGLQAQVSSTSVVKASGPGFHRARSPQQHQSVQQQQPHHQSASSISEWLDSSNVRFPNGNSRATSNAAARKKTGRGRR